ncbi:MAG: hypothetical protein CMM83_07515 [Rhodospirillales bacterium]|nr:hypothetical protein [Rhodospirillales bacterium]|tara:strand:- start:2195 stop:2713 length:519 start_codon:yes stop_codon:yes gene_type:complete
MVANVSPWSVKGVEPEAREAAKIAARRAGLTIGNWLNQIIRTAAADQLTNSNGMINSNQHNRETLTGTATKPPFESIKQAQDYLYDQQYNQAREYNAAQDFNQNSTNKEIYKNEKLTHDKITQELLNDIESLNIRLKQVELSTNSLLAPLLKQISNLSSQLAEIQSDKENSI